MAFSLAISRIFDEPELQRSELEAVQNELVLRRSMLTAVTFLVLFSVFIQVKNYCSERMECMCDESNEHMHCASVG